MTPKRPISYDNQYTTEDGLYVALYSPTLGKRKIRAEYLTAQPHRLAGSDNNTIIDEVGNHILVRDSGASSSTKRIIDLHKSVIKNEDDYVLLYSATLGTRRIQLSKLT